MALKIQLVGEDGDVSASLDGEQQQENDMSSRARQSRPAPTPPPSEPVVSDDNAAAGDADAATGNAEGTAEGGAVGTNPDGLDSGTTGAAGPGDGATSATDAPAKKATGVGRVVAAMARVQEIAQAARDLAHRWYLDGTEKKDDLKLIVDFVDGLIENAKQAQGGAAALEAASWIPPVARAKVVEGAFVTIKDEHLKDYASYGVESGMRLTADGDGPTKGVIWLKKPDGARILVAKKQLAKI